MRIRRPDQALSFLDQMLAELSETTALTPPGFVGLSALSSFMGGLLPVSLDSFSFARLPEIDAVAARLAGRPSEAPVPAVEKASIFAAPAAPAAPVARMEALEDVGPGGAESMAFLGPRPKDTLFSSQWHLSSSRSDVSLNLRDVWTDFKGAGVKIAFTDDGFDYRHPDLARNYHTGLDRDFVGRGDLDAIYERGNWHGTAVMGVAGADDNGVGTVGVAPDATLIGLRIGYGRAGNPEQYAAAIRESAKADVANHSWGFSGFFTDNFDSHWFRSSEAALKHTVDAGRGGLGTVHVFAAGNSRALGDDVNYHNYQNSIYTMAVGATDASGRVASFSTPGVALHVSAPGVSVLTTDITGRDGYSTGNEAWVQGTSFAAPAVAGVVGLMLDANAKLGWRDVQEILAYSARTSEASRTDAFWVTNKADNWNGGGLTHSKNYGFGLVDAHAAVRLAETWTEQQTSHNMQTASFGAAPRATLVDNGRWQTTFTINRDITIDRVELELDLKHNWIGDLRIGLISAEGTTSWLVDRPGVAPGAKGAGSNMKNIWFDFTTSQFWGEEARGTWTLVVEDVKRGDVGRLDWFQVNIFGDRSSHDDTYIYTNEFARLGAEASRTVINDTQGRNAINASAVTSDSVLDLMFGSVIAGRQVSYGAGTVIERAFAGDGNDQVRGNAFDNLLWGGRGNDILEGRGGADTFAFGVNSGHDVILDFDANDRILLVDGVRVSSLSGNVATLSDGATITAANGWQWQMANFHYGDLLFA